MLVGPIHTQPIINGLLVPIEVALSEIQFWSGQTTTRAEFLRYLRESDVFYGDIEEFQKLKKQAREKQSRMTANASCKLKEIADALEVSHNRIDGSKLAGKAGSIKDDGSIFVESRSKRHLSGIGRRLGFLERTDTGFRLDHTPSDREAEVIRTVLGIKKRPSSKIAAKIGAPIENGAS